MNETAVIDVCCRGDVRDGGWSWGQGREGQRLEGGSVVARMCWCEVIWVSEASRKKVVLFFVGDEQSKPQLLLRFFSRSLSMINHRSNDDMLVPLHMLIR